MTRETYQISSLHFGEDMPIYLWETYSDADFRAEFIDTVSGIMPGAEKYINAHMAKNIGKLKSKVLLHGPAFVTLVCNRSGSTLTQGSICSWYHSAVTATSGSVSTFVTSGLNADEQIGNFIVGRNHDIIGQTRQIIKNTTTTITVQPDFDNAVDNATTAEIFSSSQVTTGAGSRFQIAGVVLGPNGLPDNYWGWVCSWGRVSARIDQTVNLTEGNSLMAGSNDLVEWDGSSEEDIVGVSIASIISPGGGSAWLAPVWIDCRTIIGYTP